MSKIIKSTDGKFYVVHNYEELTAEDAQTLLSDLQSDVSVLQDAINSQPAPQPVVEQAPTPVEAPAPVEQPAPLVEGPIEQAPAPAPVEAPAPAPEVNPAPVVLQ